MISSWHSYPKIYTLGHSALINLFSDPILVEEKVDGSQFSFGKFDGVLRVKSKSVEMQVESPEKMFIQAVERELLVLQ